MKRLREIIWYHVLSKLPELNICASTKHGRFVLSNHDQVIGRELYINKSFEWDKVAKVMQFIGKDKNCVIDIGANIGTVCIPLVLNKKFKKAIAFEPEEKNFSLLNKNISINHLKENITPINMALSDVSGEAYLNISTSNYGDHRLRNKPSVSEIQKKVTVDTLDAQIQKINIKLNEIDLIWMDVQGHEFNVLKGAKSILNTKIPIVIEFWPFGLEQAGVSKQDYFNFLSSHFSGFYDLSNEAFLFQNISEFLNLFTKYKNETFTDLILFPDKP
ncbi:MAG: FkbM family methyltransferase [Oligoflexia bacterium]|nr:FkbM family methyltransferase [Oligoflexia bacterium]